MYRLARRVSNFEVGVYALRLRVLSEKNLFGHSVQTVTAKAYTKYKFNFITTDTYINFSKSLMKYSG